MSFDTCIAIDWSAASTPTPKRESANALWMAVARDGVALRGQYFRTRSALMASLAELLAAEHAAGRRVLVGFDFAFGYPAGFAVGLGVDSDPLALWTYIADRLEDREDNSNTRFELAAQLNGHFAGDGPFWGHPKGQNHPGLLPTRSAVPEGLAERRLIEEHVPQAKSVWQIAYTGSVGSQSLTGIAALDRLRRALGDKVRVWPFEPVTDARVVFAEIYPSLFRDDVRQRLAAEPEGTVRDRIEVETCAAQFSRWSVEGVLDTVLDQDVLPAAALQEGWILGVDGQGARIETRSRLRDDCFALPPGVDWTPVDVALDRLRAAARPVTAAQTIPVSAAGGRILAGEVVALVSHPPLPNSAVDGYGGAAEALLPGKPIDLVDGRSAAGAPYTGCVPKGRALRILTGAAIPDGVDTVILQEDVQREGQTIRLEGHPRPGANIRKAGEDVAAGAPVLPAGRRLTVADLALLSATGHASVAVRAKLRVAVLSTGDEITDGPLGHGQMRDANRPMLLDMVRRWGMEPVDLGIAPDDRAAVRAALDAGAAGADAILSTGGASAGDEDHMSALLGEAGALHTWRIAIKPGRPLALAQWRDVPVFGLPGNPVAAFTCAALFARPTLQVMAGAAWPDLPVQSHPAAFTKRKKPGRREVLRARLRNGAVEVYASEGSGRIAGLSWAEGFCLLPDVAQDIAPGTMVEYVPFSALGL
ncbi:molybdopterin-binding protein [Pontivivens insulae]|uniref:Molybdopterin molybdenumtransferase n=1 Tax=Pontivivens insulae TaxID=1639689 RepID=A0A2R8A9N4_9RHOB|nr:molybdopterin-binding protein [Pontivivens insulae]RED12699.1 molybdopterin molybdotransferase [Pontivivens insulae]SPF28790.1 Molybdopterin molybdenumtransferase [Pontivivens insulae]